MCVRVCVCVCVCAHFEIFNNKLNISYEFVITSLIHQALQQKIIFNKSMSLIELKFPCNEKAVFKKK